MWYPFAKSKSRTRGNDILQRDSRHVYALMGALTGISAVCKTEDLQLAARQGYGSFRQSYPQSDNV